MWVYDPSALSFLSHARVPPRTRDEPRLPCRGHRRIRTPVSVNLVRSYSSAAPRAELLKHLAINQAPGDHPGSSAPSQIRNSLRLRISVRLRTPSQSVTSLDGATRQLILVCSGRQADIVSAHPTAHEQRERGVQFQQAEERSACLPVEK